MPKSNDTLLSMWIFIFALLNAHASTTTVSTRTETHGIAKFIEYKKEVVLPGAKPGDISYLTDTRFIVDAGSPVNIEDYAVVQYIRGCVFATDSKGAQQLSISRWHFGKLVPFKHSHWQIDSDSTDPIYSAYEGYGRFGILRWNKDPSDFNAETATFYGYSKPSHGVTFVTDLPATAFLADKDHAQNASLKFKTCLFKTRDLPLTTTPEGDGFGEDQALWCVEWDHNFVYDFQARKMTKPSQIDPFCR